jgi:CheY-like chemotaxis protein
MQSKPRILLVDDKPAVLLTYRIILQQKGYEVTAVETFGSAVEKLADSEFDLLLCDLGLGEARNGFDLIEHARQARPEIQPVLVTGYAAEDVALKAADLGIAILFKPVQVPELLQTLETYTNTQQRAIA